MRVYATTPELPEWALLGEYDSGSAQGSGSTEYIWLPTPDGAILVGLVRNGEVHKAHAIHTDHLGTPRLVTNIHNEPVWQWSYSAFGDNHPSGVLTKDLDRTEPKLQMNLRFEGQYQDPDTGIVHNWHRTYSPIAGRYIQPDPIGLGGGENRFVYVDGNPLALTDPLGLRGNVPGGARLVPPTSMYRQPTLPGIPSPAPRSQPMPTWYESTTPGYVGRVEAGANLADGFGAITGGGRAGNHPSVANAVETLIDPNRSGPFVPGLGGGRCTLVSKPTSMGTCTAEVATRLVCGQVMESR